MAVGAALKANLSYRPHPQFSFVPSWSFSCSHFSCLPSLYYSPWQNPSPGAARMQRLGQKLMLGYTLAGNKKGELISSPFFYLILSCHPELDLSLRDELFFPYPSLRDEPLASRGRGGLNSAKRIQVKVSLMRGNESDRANSTVSEVRRAKRV